MEAEQGHATGSGVQSLPGKVVVSLTVRLVVESWIFRSVRRSYISMDDTFLIKSDNNNENIRTWRRGRRQAIHSGAILPTGK